MSAELRATLDEALSLVCLARHLGDREATRRYRAEVSAALDQLDESRAPVAMGARVEATGGEDLNRYTDQPFAHPGPGRSEGRRGAPRPTSEGSQERRDLERPGLVPSSGGGASVSSVRQESGGESGRRSSEPFGDTR